MDIIKKVAYIKGLADGLELDKSSKEGKVLAAMLEALEDMADTINDLCEEIDALSDDLGDVEEIVYGELDDFDDEGCCCDDDDEPCCCCGDDDEEDLELEAECPNCGADVVIGDEDIDNGYINCPQCGEKLEFEFDEDDEDEE